MRGLTTPPEESEKTWNIKTSSILLKMIIFRGETLVVHCCIRIYTSHATCNQKIIRTFCWLFCMILIGSISYPSNPPSNLSQNTLASPWVDPFPPCFEPRIGNRAGKPVEVSSLSHFLTRFYTSQVVIAGICFINSISLLGCAAGTWEMDVQTPTSSGLFMSRK